MSKKQIALTIGGIIPVIFAAIGLVILLPKIQNPVATTNSSAKALDTKLPDPILDQTYTDSSGFSFKYPKDVTVKDTTPDDDIYYSRVNVEHKGNIITIEIKDAPKEPTYQNLVGAVQLGGMSGKQYKTEFTQTTESFDKGILYLVQLHTQDAYMTKVYDGVVSSFTIGNGSSKVSDEDITYEEETVE
jgi:hypothetical protein